MGEDIKCKCVCVNSKFFNFSFGDFFLRVILFACVHVCACTSTHMCAGAQGDWKVLLQAIVNCLTWALATELQFPSPTEPSLQSSRSKGSNSLIRVPSFWDTRDLTQVLQYFSLNYALCVNTGRVALVVTQFHTRPPPQFLCISKEIRK